MKKYKQLTLGLRYQIFAYKQENYSISKIAKVLNFNKSTISRELKKTVLRAIIAQSILRFKQYQEI